MELGASILPALFRTELFEEFAALIGKIAAQGNRKGILEHFKRYFAGAAGITASYSSSTSWAEADLDDYMNQAAHNAPLFIEAFYDACEALKERDFAVPDDARMNRVLFDCEAGDKSGRQI